VAALLLRHRHDDRDVARRRTARRPPLQVGAVADGLPRPGAERALERRKGAAWRDHQGRQQPRSTTADRSSASRRNDAGPVLSDGGGGGQDATLDGGSPLPDATFDADAASAIDAAGSTDAAAPAGDANLGADAPPSADAAPSDASVGADAAPADAAPVDAGPALLAADLVGAGVPGAMLTGESRRVRVLMRNTGALRWDRGAISLMNQSPLGAVTSTATAIPLAATTATGAVASFDVGLAASAAPGSGRFTWQLAAGNGPFGELVDRPIAVMSVPPPGVDGGLPGGPDAGIGFCGVDTDCLLGEVCRPAVATASASRGACQANFYPVSVVWICKVIEHPGITGIPCNCTLDCPEDAEGNGFPPEYCGSLDPPNETFHYGYQECVHFQYSEYDGADSDFQCYGLSPDCKVPGEPTIFMSSVPSFCALGCTRSSDCPADDECLYHMEFGANPYLACEAPRCNCSDRDSYCYYGECRLPDIAPGQPCPFPLSDSNELGAPAACRCSGGGLPEPPNCYPPTCRVDDDCPAPMQGCVRGSCTPLGCSSDADCPFGRLCGVLGSAGKSNPWGDYGHYCMRPGPSLIGGSCREGGDCASGQCYAGACVEQCRRNLDCAAGEECMVGPTNPSDAPFCSPAPHCGLCRPDQFCNAFRQCADL
jgi:hypothetical protein